MLETIKGVTSENEVKTKTSGGTKLVIYLGELDIQGDCKEKQVVTPSSQFNPSHANCKQLAQAIAGERKVYKFEMV